MHRLLAAMLLVAAVAAASPQSAAVAAPANPRAAPHEGYARLVLEWPEAVAVTAKVEDGRLMLRFAQPFSGDLQRVLRPLRAYVKDLVVNDERTEASFSLLRQVRVRKFNIGPAVVIDLVDEAGDGEVAKVVLAGGAEEGFHRLVFKWPKAVAYDLRREGAQVAAVFKATGMIDPGELRRLLPAGLDVVDVDLGKRDTTLVMTLPEDRELRHFARNSEIVLEILDDGVAAPTPEARRPVKGSANQPVKPPPPETADAGQPSPSAPKTAEPVPSEPTRAAGEPGPSEEIKGQVAEMPTLTFPWAQPAGAAVFRRAGWLWVVFDQPKTVDTEALRNRGPGIIRDVEQVPHPAATILRLLVPPAYNPSLKRDGLTWILDLAQRPLRAETALAVNAETSEGGGRIVVPVAEGGQPIDVLDPEVGDTIKVIPVLPLAHGIFPGFDYPEVQLPGTAQGVVVIPRAPGLSVASARTGIDISRPDGGLSISPASRQQAASALLGGRVASSPILDVRGWARDGMSKSGKEQLFAALAESEGDRAAARLDIARFYAANGYGAEALGILRVMATDDPQAVETASFRGVRGVANFLMKRYDEAEGDFGHESLREVPEAAYWYAAARAAGGDAAGAAQLNEGIPLANTYPDLLKNELAWVAIETNLAAGDHRLARMVLDTLAPDALSAAEQTKLNYLEGLYQNLAGDFDAAVSRFSAAENGRDRKYRALAAKAKVDLLLEREQITRREAIEALDRLRFAWRAPEYEFPLLKRLGELEIADGDYSGGLRTLKQLVSSYGQHPDIGSVAQTMSDTFAKLYLEGAADALPPVTAIALYDEFRELTPTGVRGDEMIRRLADRMIAVDLLDRAGELLKHQVEFRLTGVEKARVGAQLAVVRLLDQKPEQALLALSGSEAADIPDDLRRQRLYLQARALDDSGRPGPALALLAKDETPTAALLRAEIHWRTQNWKEAAADFKLLVGDPPPGAKLDDMTARLVLHWATALSLASNDPALAQLRARFGREMAATAYRDAFDLLTVEAPAETIDQRSIAARIKEAEQFQSFMAAYRERLRAEGLAAIN